MDSEQAPTNSRATADSPLSVQPVYFTHLEDSQSQASTLLLGSVQPGHSQIEDTGPFDSDDVTHGYLLTTSPGTASETERRTTAPTTGQPSSVKKRRASSSPLYSSDPLEPPQQPEHQTADVPAIGPLPRVSTATSAFRRASASSQSDHAGLSTLSSRDSARQPLEERLSRIEGILGQIVDRLRAAPPSADSNSSAGSAESAGSAASATSAASPTTAGKSKRGPKPTHGLVQAEGESAQEFRTRVDTTLQRTRRENRRLGQFLAETGILDDEPEDQSPAKARPSNEGIQQSTSASGSSSSTVTNTVTPAVAPRSAGSSQHSDSATASFSQPFFTPHGNHRDHQDLPSHAFSQSSRPSPARQSEARAVPGYAPPQHLLPRSFRDRNLNRAQFEHNLPIPFDSEVVAYFLDDPVWQVHTPRELPPNQAILCRRPRGLSAPPTDIQRVYNIVVGARVAGQTESTNAFYENRRLAEALSAYVPNQSSAVDISDIVRFANPQARTFSTFLQDYITALHEPIRFVLPSHAIVEALCLRLAPFFAPDQFAAPAYEFIERIAAAFVNFYQIPGNGGRSLYFELSQLIVQQAFSDTFDPANGGHYGHAISEDELNFHYAQIGHTIPRQADPALIIATNRRATAPTDPTASFTSKFYAIVEQKEFYPNTNDYWVDRDNNRAPFCIPVQPLLSGSSSFAISTAISEHLVRRFELLRATAAVRIRQEDFRALFRSILRSLTPAANEQILLAPTRAFENDLAEQLYAETVRSRPEIRVSNHHLLAALDNVFGPGQSLAQYLLPAHRELLNAQANAFRPDPPSEGILAREFYCPLCERRQDSHHRITYCSVCGPPARASTRALCSVCFNDEAPEPAETALTPPDAFAPSISTEIGTPLVRISHESEVALIRYLPEYIDRVLAEEPVHTRVSLRRVLDAVISTIAVQSRSTLPPSPYSHPVSNWHTSIKFQVILPDPSSALDVAAAFSDDEIRSTAE